MCASSPRECSSLREKTTVLYNHRGLNTQNRWICCIPEKQCSSEPRMQRKSFHLVSGTRSLWRYKPRVFIYESLGGEMFEIDSMGKAKHKLQRTTWKLLLPTCLNWKHRLTLHFLWVPTAQLTAVISLKATALPPLVHVVLMLNTLMTACLFTLNWDQNQWHRCERSASIKRGNQICAVIQFSKMCFGEAVGFSQMA